MLEMWLYHYSVSVLLMIRSALEKPFPGMNAGQVAIACYCIISNIVLSASMEFFKSLTGQTKMLFWLQPSMEDIWRSLKEYLLLLCGTLCFHVNRMQETIINVYLSG